MLTLSNPNGCGQSSLTSFEKNRMPFDVRAGTGQVPATSLRIEWEHIKTGKEKEAAHDKVQS